MSGGKPSLLLPLGVLAVALAGVSFGSIFVRLAVAPALAIALWRMTFASMVAVPAAVMAGGSRTTGDGRHRLLAVVAGGMLALHFGTWISSLDYTSVAASVLLVNTAPVFVALLAWLTGRRPTAATWTSVALATAGAAVIASDETRGHVSFVGDVLALAGAVAMAGYLLLAREAQRGLGYLTYVAIAYASAALVLWIVVGSSATQWSGFTVRTWWILAAMAVVSQLVGHGGYNWSLRHLQPAFVAVALTGEPVVASFLAWRLLGEPLTWRIAAGGLLVLAGILVALRAAAR